MFFQAKHVMVLIFLSFQVVLLYIPGFSSFLPLPSIPPPPSLSFPCPPPLLSSLLLLQHSLGARQCPKCSIWIWCHLILTTYCKWGHLGSEKQCNLPKFIELICWQCSSLNSVLPDATGCAQHAVVMLPVYMCCVTWTSGWWTGVDTWLKKSQYFFLAAHTGRMVLSLSQWNLYNEIAKGKKVGGISDTFMFFNSWFALSFF